jgi:hypothetical protein
MVSPPAKDAPTAVEDHDSLRQDFGESGSGVGHENGSRLQRSGATVAL